ncbi:MAG TPA: tetratricopeptide repeat protein [Candidatus Eisenbacteria bacterium]
MAALPQEAQLFYRYALSARKAGQEAEAIRWMRAAASLDPSFAAPHLALASWFAFHEPSQALLSCATLLDLARQDFRLQLHLIANGVFFLLHAWFFGLVVAALLVVGLHQRQLRHLLQERFSTVVGPGPAAAWAWVLLFVPCALGFGLALPAALFLGILWPLLRAKERLLFILLAAQVVAAPLASHLMGRLALPLYADRAPFYGVASLEHQPYAPSHLQELAERAAEHPENAFLQFGLAWTARQGVDLADAEAGYRRVLRLWPGDDRASNNLGNLLAAQGKLDEALERYRAAVHLNPRNAAAYFNAAQVHTRRFDYAAASDAMAHASALDFEMVRRYQDGAGAEGTLPLVDQWIAPATFWRAMLRTDGADVTPAWPPAWRGLVEAWGWRFSGVAAILTLVAVGLGLWWQRELPLRPCSNCGRIVCRRCAKRRREEALCPECHSVAARAESLEFSRVLLGQRARKLNRTGRWAQTVIAALIPGFGPLAVRRVFGGVLLLVASSALVSSQLGIHGPFLYESRTGLGSATGGGLLACVGWGVIYGVSLLVYFGQIERDSLPMGETTRSRPTSPSWRLPRAA